MTEPRPLRMAPLPAEEWDDATRAALSALITPDRANPAGAGNVLSTLVRHHRLTEAYLPFNAYLLTRSTLSMRVREVALLRAVHHAGCEYLWSHHLPIAARAGLSPRDVDGIRTGHCPGGDDQTVLRAVDDLAANHVLDEQNWEALGDIFSDEQRLDLIFTIGGYLLLAMVVNTLGIQDEHE